MKSPKRPSLQITRIAIQNWRNFAKVDVELRQRAFLVGPNASGKSNFLDVFRFLHDLVVVGGGFQEAVRRRGGVSKLRCLAARRHSDIGIEVRATEPITKDSWKYSLRFKQDNRQRPIVESESVSHNEENLLARPNEEDKADEERLTQSYIEQVNVNRDFRRLAEFFGSIRYLHLVPQLVRDPERYVARSRDPFGSDFLEQVAATPERTRSARFRHIQEALRVAVPQLQELEFFRDSIRGTPHLRGKYQHWREKGAWQTEEQLSDGTLRLLGLLWAILDGNGPLLLEEPELSLHSSVVSYLPQMFARTQRRSHRQIMISTHSPDLIREEGIGLEEVLLLRPSEEGTAVLSADSIDEVKNLLEGGISLPDALLPHTRPPNPHQLALFDL
jgi:predicted ATPase